MSRHEELTIEDGRVATLTRNQTWTTHAAQVQIVGDLLVVADDRTGSQVDAIVYNQNGKRKIGILKQVVVWERTKNPALDPTSFDAFEIPDALPDQAEELWSVYERFQQKSV